MPHNNCQVARLYASNQNKKNISTLNLLESPKI